MIVADIGRGVMYASMAFVGRLWAIFLLSFAIECLSLLWSPARDASLPNMVPRRQLANANSLGLVSTYGTLPLGGAVFAVLDLGESRASGSGCPSSVIARRSLALLLDAATFGFSAFMVSRIAFPAPVHGLAGRFDLSKVWRDIVDGVKFLREDSIASAMTGGIVVAFAAVGAVLALGPIFVTTLDDDQAAWGVVVTAFGVGMFLGMATASQVNKLVERDVAFVWALARGRRDVVRAGRDAEPRAHRGRLGVARRVLRSRVGERLHPAAGERRGRVPGSNVRLADDAVPAGFVPQSSRSSLSCRASMMTRSISAAIISTSRAPDSPCGPPGCSAAVAGLNTRRLLKRHRLSRPQPLALVPKLKRPPATGVFIAFEGVEGAGKGTPDRARRGVPVDAGGRRARDPASPAGPSWARRSVELLLDPDHGQARRRAARRSCSRQLERRPYPASSALRSPTARW